MTKPRIFVTRRIPQEGLEILKRCCQVEVSDYDGVIPRSLLLEKVKDTDGLLVLLTDMIDKKVIVAAGKKLRVISNYAVGYNNIDVVEATKRGIMVTNTPGVLTETTADLAWALLMCIGRRIVEGDKLVRAGKFRGWEPMLLLGTDIHESTLGLIGFGRIGQAMARRAKGFNLKVIYYDREPVPPIIEKELGASYVSFDELLRKSDFISVHVPLTEETFHLIGQEEFSMMKKESYLINTARGPIIDEKALVKALKGGVIRGAALDVFENEPAIEQELMNMDNVVIVPHIGSASYRTRTKMAIMAAKNLISALKGERPEFLVNSEVLGKN
ncbi:MAG: D-glycerate dehydrogenase [Atribacterota bacterium]|jgi:glyoxylate reductase|uniref:Putative 2-hydroxyacid dehydrogenase n=1 Tax=Candidatus Atribacter allofermentans TaxID=1852833 RepID=A0A1V5SKF2_9BACT|nr:D-glycerate dehydrogenase [Atribacterota bacterium]OQA54965.1 MAG: putative 2-hydroxyacid dehydrogenase [Candidatus Atribacteria bacterium ADurb.Bin276]